MLSAITPAVWKERMRNQLGGATFWSLGMLRADAPDLDLRNQRFLNIPFLFKNTIILQEEIVRS